MIEKLKALVDAGRVPHALVIDGGSYDARLLAARELSAELLSDREKVMAGNSPDVIVVLPEEKKKTLSVEVIRQMRDDAYIIPNENEKKIYIIAKAELMQDYAQNALLKILEEPPVFATFILLCDTHSVLLDTILSRVAVFNIGDITGDGENETSATCEGYARTLASLIAKRDSFGLLSFVAVFEKNFELLSPTLDVFLRIIRDALVLQSSGTTLISGAEDEAKALSSALGSSELLSKKDGVEEIIKAINIYGNKNLILTRLVSKLGGQND